MSKENVALFTKAANKKPELNERLAAAHNTADWVRIARETGFEFTAEDFRAVVEDTIHRKVTVDNAAQEYQQARKAMAAGELDHETLGAVSGGMVAGRPVVKPKYIEFPPMFIQVKKP